jgi:membrane-bound metal-dependent hydrolase YbcI (DUF457 family)
MFIGHFAVALGAKKFSPQVSLGVLFLACQLADLIWPSLVLVGLESVAIEPGNTVLTPLHFQHYPYSHSLVAMVLWGLLFGLFYMVVQRARAKTAIILSVLVLSHWFLDVITHRADMPIVLNDSIRIGFGLWNYPILAVTSEILLFAVGVGMYTHSTRPRNRKGTIGFWTLVVFLLFIYALNLLGPPPPSDTAVAWSAQALWLIVAWGFWIDHHRVNINDHQS